MIKQTLFLHNAKMCGIALLTCFLNRIFKHYDKENIIKVIHKRQMYFMDISVSLIYIYIYIYIRGKVTI